MVRKSVASVLVVLILVGAASSMLAPPAEAAPPGPVGYQLLSVSDAVPPLSGNDDSREPSMSSDGHFVVFTSSASNLGSIATTARHDQVYLRDTVTGSTRAVSAAGGVLGDGDSDRAVISADGLFVAFVSTATNLVPSSRSTVAQVLLWSRASGTLSHVSISNDLVPTPANGRAIGVALSGDGSKVVFSSNATNLVGAPTAGLFQIFSRDLTTGVTSLVSVDPRAPGTGVPGDAMYPAISSDGKVVAFATAAPLTPVDTRGKFQVVVRDALGRVQLASVGSSETYAGSQDSYAPSLSADGRVVAFVSDAPELSPFGAAGKRQIFARDLVAKSTQLVSVDRAGRAPGNGSSYGAEVSDDGSTVAFHSGATNLVPETGAQKPEITGRVYVRSLAANLTRSACRAANQVQTCNEWSGSPTLSADGSSVAFASGATDLVPEIASRSAQVFLHDLRESPRVDRIGGADRFTVSAATATDAFSTGVPVAYVASGAVFADALSGSAAAGAQRGPVLLVTKDLIPTRVGIELNRLKPQRIVLLGGTNSVDADVEAALAAYSPVVTRISGADRYEVSAKVSRSAFGGRDSVGGEHPPVYVASGEVFPDALSGSAAAGSVGGPVLLVTKNSVPAAVKAELGRLAPSRIIALGGRSTLSDAVLADLGSVAPTTRVDGADRFVVSAAVSAKSFPTGAHTVYIASGAVFPDALSGAAAAIQNRGPVLLVTSDRIPASIATELERLGPTRIVVLGGQNSVATEVLSALEDYLE